jgi:hypothetical protein
MVATRQEAKEMLMSRRRVERAVTGKSAERGSGGNSGSEVIDPAVAKQFEVFCTVQDVIILRVLLELWRLIFAPEKDGSVRALARDHLTCFLDTWLDAEGKLMDLLLHYRLDEASFDLLSSTDSLLSQLHGAIARVMDVRASGAADAANVAHAAQKNDSLPFFTFTAQVLCAHFCHLQHLIEVVPSSPVTAKVLDESAPFLLRALRSVHVFQETKAIKRSMLDLMAAAMRCYPQCARLWVQVFRDLNLQDEPPLVKYVAEVVLDKHQSRALLANAREEVWGQDGDQAAAERAMAALARPDMEALLQAFAGTPGGRGGVSSSKERTIERYADEDEWEPKASSSGNKRRRTRT